MFKKSMFFLIILILIFVSSDYAKKAKTKKVPVLLQQEYKEGLIIRYKITEDIANTMMIEGNAIDQNTNLSFEITTEITQIVKDTVLIEILIDRAVGSMTSRGNMELIPQIGELKGKSIQVELLANGEVLDIKGDEELTSENSFGEIDGLIRSLYGFLPEEQVRIGATWEKEGQEEGDTTQTVYTLTEFKKAKKGKETALISTKSEVSINKNIEQGSMKMKMELNGKTRGKIIISMEDGFVLTIKNHAALEGMSYIESKNGNMEIPTYYNQDIKFKRIK